MPLNLRKAQKIIDRGGVFTELAKSRLEKKLEMFNERVGKLEGMLKENRKRKEKNGN